MKTFQIFKEDLKKSLSPLKDLGKEFAGKAEKFANSKDAKNLKTSVFNLFLDKAQEVTNNANDRIKNARTKVNK